MKAWVVSVDMGYGHQRAAYPLKDIAYERIITANSDKIISYEEKKLWEKTRSFYEWVSRLKRVPLLGKAAFRTYDKMQSISPFFPFRDLSKPNFLTMVLKRYLDKGLCRSLIDYIGKKELPLVTTHPVPAIAADYYGMKEIYCVVTDTDISRAWVPPDPKSNITYFAPCVHVAVRLREYGVDEDKIIFTGFPLPKENLGNNSIILKEDLGKRLPNLDPNGVFRSTYEDTLKKKLGKHYREKPTRPLTITFAVGGAGAQADIGIKIADSLKSHILRDKVRLNLIAGTRLNVRSYFNRELKKMGLSKVNVVYALDKRGYFSAFNKVLRETDIIWSKPSEMSFYTALGFPIIVAPPIGAHEHYNLEWLSHIGSGFVQKDPQYVKDWLFYWLENGRLAEAAWEGWIEAPSLGTYKIEEVLNERGN